MLNQNGITTTREADTFACEEFFSGPMRVRRIQWDYRDEEGELHSGIAKTVEEAKEKARKFGYRG